MALTGDFSRLALLRQRLEQLGRAEGLRPIIDALTMEAHRQALQGFIEQRDPYGRPWAPRKPPPSWAIRAFGLMQDNHPLLDKSGDGIDNLTARGMAFGIRFRTMAYMKFHLTGTVKMVARQWLPMRGLGQIWGEAFNRVALNRIRERLGLNGGSA